MKLLIVIENVYSVIDQIAQTTLRKVVGQHTLDETLAALKDIQLPDSMKRAMARQTEVETERRAEIIAAKGESLAGGALVDASDTMMADPLALQLRNPQTLVELGVDKNTTVVFPAPLMSAISELGAFMARETALAKAVKTPGVAATGMPRGLVDPLAAVLENQARQTPTDFRTL